MVQMDDHFFLSLHLNGEEIEFFSLDNVLKMGMSFSQYIHLLFWSRVKLYVYLKAIIVMCSLGKSNL